MPDGSWFTDKVDGDSYKLRSNLEQWHEKHSYIYFTRSGKVQSTIATISVEDRRWKHIPTGKIKYARDIEVEFADELGSEAGSWKGGTIGCSYEMLPDETPLETLRRMEKTRSFS